MWVYVAAIGAALLFGSGSVIQQRAAAAAPPEKVLSFGLLLWLVKRRLWLAGTATSLVGNVLSAIALGAGGVELVQPLFTVRLIFALPLAAAWSRTAVRSRDWAGCVATVAGLAVFIAVGHPGKGDPLAAQPSSWIVAGAALATIVAVATLIARRLDVVREAALIAAGAGVLFGLQASLTEASVTTLRHQGVVGLLTGWHPYAVLAAALVGSVLVQSAYEMAPLPASFPALVTAEPLTGIGVGVGVLGATLRTSPGALFAEVAGLGIMVGGIYLLATSPLVTGQIDALRRRRDEGLAYRVVHELERDLRRLQEGLSRCAAPVGPKISDDLRRARRELVRLSTLQEDMRRHKTTEQEHLRSRPTKERLLLEPLDRELDAREAEIDVLADLLRAELSRLERRPSSTSQAGIREQ